jgi:probable rRNA maturation factor
MILTNVSFHFADKKIRINNTVFIKNFISKIFEMEQTPFIKIDYIFCSDEYLLKLNKKFLKHNYYTDVVSFSLNERKKPIIGEVYISIERILDNSKKYNVLFKTELLRVIFHGILHFCGYNDKTKKQVELIRLKENEYLKLFESLVSSDT